jgi:hypothetical protein
MLRRYDSFLRALNILLANAQPDFFSGSKALRRPSARMPSYKLNRPRFAAKITINESSVYPLIYVASTSRSRPGAVPADDFPRQMLESGTRSRPVLAASTLSPELGRRFRRQSCRISPGFGMFHRLIRRWPHEITCDPGIVMYNSARVTSSGGLGLLGEAQTWERGGHRRSNAA